MNTATNNPFQLAWYSTRQQWRVILFIYCVDFILSGLLSYVALQWVEQIIGHTTSFQKLMDGWNQQVVSDFFAQHGDGFIIWMTFFTITSLFYVISRFFWNAGIFYQCQVHQFSMIIFWRGMYKHIRHILLISIPFIFLGVAWFLGIVAILRAIFSHLPFENEHFFWQSVFGLFLLFVGGCVLIRVYGLLAQHRIVINSDYTFLHVLRKVIKTNSKRVVLLWIFYLFFLVIYVYIIYGIIHLELLVGMNETSYIFSFFLLYQLIHFLRKIFYVFFRHWLHHTIIRYSFR